jgi:hypothetical protein
MRLSFDGIDKDIRKEEGWVVITGTREGNVRRAYWTTGDQNNHWFLVELWDEDFYVVCMYDGSLNGNTKTINGPIKDRKTAMLTYKMTSRDNDDE